MKNSMNDLNNHLFAQLERLGNEELTSDQVADEVSKSKSIALIASRLAENAKIELEAKKLIWESQIEELPGILKPKALPLHAGGTQ